MSDLEISGPEEISIHFKKYQGQLSEILKAYSANQDDALLSGFLTFAHSKCLKFVDEILTLAAYSKTSVEVAQLIMDCCWRNVHYPIFKWFQLWRQHLISIKVDQKPRVVELRKMNSKLTKFFKIIHRFYYCVLERLNSECDLGDVIPKRLLAQLNLQPNPQISNRETLQNDDGKAVSVMFLIHGSLLNLGSSHRYKTMCERTHNGPQDLSHFKKSMRYFNLATMVLPSVGELYLQEGLVYVHVKSFGSSTYSFARSALARLPSSGGFTNFVSSVCDRDSKIFNQLVEAFHNVHKQAAQGKIVNREVIEIYFLVSFGAKFAPDLWIGNDRKSLISEVMLSHVEQEVMHKTATKYAKNLQLIFHNLILIIGGFDILRTLNRKSSDQSKAQSVETNYLEFSMKYISNFINNVVVRELSDENEWVYLAFVRVTECWLMANKSVLHFAHRNANFCEAMMHLMNSVLDNTKFAAHTTDLSHRPHRPYYFDEDVLLRDFKPLKYSLSDFKDTELFSSKNSSEAFLGMVDKKLSKKEEHALRLEAIAVSGKKFLSKNSCGIQFVDNKFVISAVKTKAGQKWDPRFSKLSQSASSSALSMRDIEARLQDKVGPTTWGYSGSSVPLAPTTLEVRPSFELTQRREAEASSSPNDSQSKTVDIMFSRPPASEAQTDSPVSSSIVSLRDSSPVSNTNSNCIPPRGIPVGPPPGMHPRDAPMSRPSTAQGSPAYLSPMHNLPPMYFNESAQSSNSLPLNLPQEMRQTFEVPYYPQMQHQMMNSSYMQFMPHTYQPMAYSAMPPQGHSAHLRQPTQFVQQSGDSQNQPFSGNYAYSQY
ncbi:LANO_0G07580g1_1 [Lachancea nothofagi CBS 11611]|uniref:LANO_0G07580g1_1 n=1 Tax=Lachancea nothofagi CBS 11611 TaxID=1266666 RepID=A0A1G4KHG6_9SACH|nr:LANO_0G07580g1_1 [Lachancea nothofagi CBS 11611]